MLAKCGDGAADAPRRGDRRRPRTIDAFLDADMPSLQQGGADAHGRADYLSFIV